MVLEITEGEDGERPQVMIRDKQADDAWLRTAVDHIESLPEMR